MTRWIAAWGTTLCLAGSTHGSTPTTAMVADGSVPATVPAATARSHQDVGAAPRVRPTSAQVAPARILVMPFENVARDARIFWLTEASAVLLTDDFNA